MHSLGKLQRIPPAALLLDLQSESQQVLHTLPPAGIVMLANALHMLGVKQPIVSWQFSYLQAAQNVLQECTARELAVLAVPLMRWRQVPPQGWVQQYMALCQQKLPDMTPQVSLFVCGDWCSNTTLACACNLCASASPAFPASRSWCM